MNSQKIPELLVEEFAETSALHQQAALARLEAKVIPVLTRDLRWQKWRIASSAIAIHLVMALFVVAVCPQLGWRVFDFNGLQQMFMMFGHLACTFLCGLLFISASVTGFFILLPRHYFNYLHHIRYFEVINLVALSLGAAFLFGDLISVSHLLLWAMGGLMGGFLAFQACYQFRQIPVFRSRRTQ